uniref:Uncharacterized protein n=1 Tax=Calcidiscus leptoporus TaxID=127549 RepID=A0A7S0J1V5_9EUKA|mmetsp:Transcript_34222/g.80189  ORF Transcript_34222/g.80189 Transcript_34222/m.80189 type:complete len:260 (+) Transcript_34222:16-795(+)
MTRGIAVGSLQLLFLVGRSFGALQAPMQAARGLCSLPRVVIPVMKGRALGGGPAIRTKPQKKRLAAALTPAKPGEQRSGKKKRIVCAVARGRQWQRFSAQLREGCPSWEVLVRAQGGSGSSEWLEVGDLSVSESSVERAMQAARLQKRLVLEHAVRLRPSLSQHRDLEYGVRLSNSQEEPVPVSEALANNNTSVTVGAQLEARSCGFKGRPVASKEGHYFAASERATSTGKKVKLERMGTDSKSAVAEKFSKQLGLRSG